MARKKDHALLLLTEVPWCVSVIISGTVYVGMRWILPSIKFQNLVLKSLATVGPKLAWIIALLLLFPAVDSFIKRSSNICAIPHSELDSVRKLSWWNI